MSRIALCSVDPARALHLLRVSCRCTGRDQIVAAGVAVASAVVVSHVTDGLARGVGWSMRRATRSARYAPLGVRVCAMACSTAVSAYCLRPLTCSPSRHWRGL